MRGGGRESGGRVGRKEGSAEYEGKAAGVSTQERSECNQQEDAPRGTHDTSPHRVPLSPLSLLSPLSPLPPLFWLPL